MRILCSSAASTMAVSLLLAGCGGGGGGSVVSTPPPTLPAVEYTKLQDVKEGQEFASASVRYYKDNADEHFTGIESFEFGSGINIILNNEAGTSYALTTKVGGFNVFPTDVSMSDSTIAPRGAKFIFERIPHFGPDGTDLVRSFYVFVPSINSVKLSYTSLAGWSYPNDREDNKIDIVFGMPTVTSDMPKTGAANYTMGVYGVVDKNGIFVVDQDRSSGTFSVNFSDGSFQTSLHLMAFDEAASTKSFLDFGTYNGTGKIASGSSAFNGTFANTALSGINGNFFGPQASEMAYLWHIQDGTMLASGNAWGKKN